MDKRLEGLRAAAHRIEGVNTITLFVLFPLAAIYGVWEGDWRPCKTAAIVAAAVFVLGLFIVTAKDRAESAAKKS